MDPISCLSLASNVAQLIDFSFKIYSGTRQLYEKCQVYQASETTKKSLVLCKECSKIADGMITQLKNSEVAQKQNCLKSVGQVLKSMWSSKEPAEAEKKLA
ncbi:hypothetical protein HYFRA_00011665 [Hymenoscyphus fraxineus]|uniref:Uncharacterized protein n=1 Tax=Hymenoscyphus fraxineus TaxID=746836 RepID=A0A9N9KXL3_9HELO|nr:hypothetical protein HYFRA_00011665 [Hymenoscyphus fraxineus]